MVVNHSILSAIYLFCHLSVICQWEIYPLAKFLIDKSEEEDTLIRQLLETGARTASHSIQLKLWLKPSFPVWGIAAHVQCCATGPVSKHGWGHASVPLWLADKITSSLWLVNELTSIMLFPSPLSSKFITSTAARLTSADSSVFSTADTQLKICQKTNKWDTYSCV